MISKNAANVAINIAQEFDRRRLGLVPSGPLAELVSSSCLTEIAQDRNAEYVPEPELIEAMSSGYTDDGSSKHDQELATFSEQIAQAASSHLQHAKTVVRPVITEMVEGVTADIEGIPAEERYSRTITQVGLAEPLRSAAFVQAVDEFKNVPYEPVRAYVNLGPKSTSEIIDLLVTGAADTDEAIKAWAVAKGDVLFQRVWNSVFTDAPTNERFDALIQDTSEGTDAAIVVFLVAKRVHNDPPEGTGVALSAYNQTLADLRNQAALRIDQGIESYARAVRTGLLIQRIDHNEVQVTDVVYEKWLQAGGHQGILFGALLADRPPRFLGDITERADEFKKLWEQVNAMLTAKARNNRFVTIKQILRERGEKVIADNMATIFNVVAAEGQEVSKDLPAYQQAIQCLGEFVDGVREPDFKDIWTLCTKLICRSAFYYTSAEQILLGIDQACKDNPDIDIREAALISLIEYVTDFVCNQIEIKSI